ncbi:sugar ABC transporter ATP-binding protein [Nocardioides nitrophenolicus]|uniref:sugar ABC transporter ATP-binding protein n=1 Tax=Nocardioides nitrophenolicus TaxID=60489 RepID=UPI00195C4A11|nr:sugar ABC transporter ATP-binding protein [Nocardioides nitrophenolicus]MBM7519893.1 ribose transport system ATP-binding protein [Nocardioides nitrophenolicus]
MTSTPTIRLAGVSKSYGPVHALRDVSLEVRPGEVLGLIGENGAGKSTLIGVLSGTVRPDSGRLTIGDAEAPLGDPRALSGLGISVVVQEQALVDALRVHENIYLGREYEVGGRGPGRRARLRAAARALLEDLHIAGVAADDVVADLTYPQRQLVEIAKAFSRAGAGGAAPVILLDEPTSALSETEVEILFDLVERWRERVSFIFVSHILQDVLRISTRLLVLRDGRTVDTLDNRGISAERLHELMVGTERSTDYYREHEQLGARADEPVLELRGAGVTGEFEGVDLQVRPGEIVGLAGVIGSGKSTLAAAVAGAHRLDAGSVVLDGRVRRRWSSPAAVAAGVLYVPPERALDSLFATASVRGNISIGFLDLLRSKWTRLLRLREERVRAAALADRLRIKTKDLGTPIGELSGGNQQKAVFARWQGRSCRVLVLNDPTRGIDVGTREEIYGLIRDLATEGIGVLLCAESLEEVIGMADRIVVMKDGVVTAEIASPTTAKPTEVDVIKHMM